MNPHRDIVNTALRIHLHEQYIGPFPSSYFTPVEVANPKLEAMAREHRQFSDPSHPHHEVYTGAFMNHYDKHGDVVDSHRAAINAVTTPPKEKQLTLASRFRYHENKRLNTEEIEIPATHRHIPRKRIEDAIRIAQAELDHRRQNDPNYMPEPSGSVEQASILGNLIARHNIHKETIGQQIDVTG